MKKIYLLTILILAGAMNLNAARLPLPDIDIEESAKSSSIQTQVSSQTPAVQDSTKFADSFTMPEFEGFNFKEENLGTSDFSAVETPNIDATGAFGNLENLTKTLQANFQNAFNNIKSLTVKYNSLSSRYQELVKKYNFDMKNVIQKAQGLQKQFKTAVEYYNKSKEENAKLKEENLRMKNAIQQQTDSLNKLNSAINQKNAQLQNLNSQYEKAVSKLQQIKSTLTME